MSSSARLGLAQLAKIKLEYITTISSFLKKVLQKYSIFGLKIDINTHNEQPKLLKVNEMLAFCILQYCQVDKLKCNIQSEPATAKV